VIFGGIVNLCFHIQAPRAFLQSNTRNYSETVASEIDQEINRIVKESYSRCEAILKANTEKLHELAQYLIKNEKIDADDFEKLMKGELQKPLESIEAADTQIENSEQ